MEEFSKNVKQQLDVDGNGERKYYVYGLIDPFTFNTFYVGKGCGDRVFKHAKNAIKKLKADEDKQSLKISTIQSIMQRGKDVLTVIYRWGLTEETALLIEATLIDILPGLTNIQGGYDVDHGMISTEDLQKSLDCAEYTEPSEDYVIIKTKETTIHDRGSVYDAVRGSWTAKLENTKDYKYVVAVVQGVVREVYDVSRWFTSPTRAPRIDFEGKPTQNAEMHKLVGKLIPQKYRRKGMALPILRIKRKND